MHVRVDEPGAEPAAAPVDALATAVAADAREAPVRDGDVALEPFTRERAEHLRSYSYRTVKNILASAQDRLPFEDDPPGHDPTPTHDNIRGAGYYAASEENEC